MVLAAVQLAILGTSQVGRILTGSLVKHHPLLLLLLNAGDGTLILVARQVRPWEYFVLGGTRALIVLPCAYLLGKNHGGAILGRLVARRRLRFLDTRSGLGFRAGTGGLLLVSLNTASALLAGLGQLRGRVVVGLALLGVVLRLALIYAFATRYASAVKRATDVLDRYQLWFAFALALLAAASVWHRLRRARRQTDDNDDDTLNRPEQD